jgi:hypothetical protein
MPWTIMGAASSRRRRVRLSCQPPGHERGVIITLNLLQGGGESSGLFMPGRWLIPPPPYFYPKLVYLIDSIDVSENCIGANSLIPLGFQEISRRLIH